MKQWVKRYMSFLLVMLLCVGCGKVPGTSGDSSEGGSGEQSHVVVSSEEGSGRTYRVEQTITIAIEDPDTDFSNKTIYSGAYGSMLYLLVSYQLEGETEPAMWMYIFNLQTQETEKLPFFLETPGMEDPYISSMTVTGRDELTFRIYGVFEGGDASSYLCRTDVTGKPLDEENPFSEDTGYPPETGRFVAVPGGAPFLAEMGESAITSLSRYDEQSQKPVFLTTVNGIVNALCSDGRSGLYYVDSTRLRHLNLKDMTEEILCNTAECGIKMAYENWLLSDGEGELAFCAVSDNTTVIYLLTNQSQAETERETIRMARLTGYNPIIALAYEWAALSDNYSIIMDEIPLEEERETNLVAEQIQMREPLRTRIMAELVSGKGPELMYVSEDDMHVLAEKGVLMDLSELIPEEIQEQLLPGVRPMGTVDGTWVGITQEVWYYTLMTADSLWSEDSWTVSDILDLVESRDDWDWILSEPYFDAVSNYNKLFERGFSINLGDSPFIDMESGVSHFNSEEFIRTLELCKRYAQSGDVAVGHDDAARSMEEGKSIARRFYLFAGLHDFSEAVAAYGNCHIVGFPSEKGSGNYMTAQGYLVVNAKAGHVDAIKDYIAYILGYDVQFGTDNSVRRDAIRDQVGNDPDICETPYTWSTNVFNGGYDPWPLENLKPDGTTYLEEFLEFAESCQPMPYCPEAISGIVKEEIGAYFTGDKSAENTADLIHRRVQLYFDERN